MKHNQLRVRTKICGITRVEDALAAANAGADAIGLVFYDKSPRHVTLAQAAAIVKALPPFVTSTALFVNPEADLVHTVIDHVGVDLLQFHGEESMTFCESFGRPYFKAIRMQADTDLKACARAYAGAKGLLLDTYVKGVPGGTGAAFNWQWVTKDKTADLGMPIILAGGLNEKNVSEAVKIVEPWAVDVSGGVEASAGIKSEEKVAQFIQAVND
ncbi:MAG: phosphoribosylanthranilate isomerase [Hydrogenovibrio sp.]|nr:phosphoribosylanthranilate isomerase [Hydrogenovibrio sp.]